MLAQAFVRPPRVGHSIARWSAKIDAQDTLPLPEIPLTPLNPQSAPANSLFSPADVSSLAAVPQSLDPVSAKHFCQGFCQKTGGGRHDKSDDGREVLL